MVAYNKFQDFVDQLGQAKHSLGTHTFSVALTNSAPSATNTILTNITQISYTYYTDTLTVDRDLEGVAWVEASGTGTFDANDFTITASGGTLATWQYLVLYNNSQTSPADPLIAWWNNGSAISLADGESIVIDFGADAGTDGDIFTLV